jgi:hypothetical protein
MVESSSGPIFARDVTKLEAGFQFVLDRKCSG